jgi:YidC/Oxa1 family membrane protein insertase
MDNNRTILAVILIVLLWSGYSMFFAPQRPVVENQKITPPSNDKITVDTNLDNIPKDPVNDVDYKITDDQNYSDLKVSTPLYDVVLTSKGASIKFFDLKKYKKNKSSDENFVLFGKKNDFITLTSTGSDGLPLSPNLNYSLPSSVSDNLNIDSKRSITLTGKSENFKIEKTYTFFPENYSFDLKVKITNLSENTLSGKFNLLLNTPYIEEENSMMMYSFTGPISFDGSDLKEDKVKDLKKSPVIYTSDTNWSGYTTKYFVTLVKPLDSVAQYLITANDNSVHTKYISPRIELKPENSTVLSYSTYFGPKQQELLAKTGNGFESAINYGFFHFLAKPLMVVLKFFYSYIGNYGFAIILLTVCIKILFWPLTQKSYKSMKGMQKLQPEMKRLREKYGSDKQRLNQEMMTFYKENKVNPMGGCLPMIIQIPVFIALYRVLLSSIELRHAPFMLWITDLSVKDPYYITPLIMGATMFLQQKMTPTNMDPTQEKVMLMMPIVFTFLFLNFPAGLVIYWLTNNVLTIFQQYLIRRQPD